MKYLEIRDELKTGDIVLFGGKGGVSDVIKYFSMSKFSHIGMVFDMPEYGMKGCWESTTLSNLTDMDSGVPTKGVQIVPLSDRINSYDGDVVIRQLEKPLTDEQMAILIQFRHDMKGKPYERSQSELFKSLYDGWGGKNEKDLSSLFCSELVAEAYQLMKLLSLAEPSNEKTPADFSAKNGMQLICNSLLPELVIEGM